MLRLCAGVRGTEILRQRHEGIHMFVRMSDVPGTCVLWAACCMAQTHEVGSVYLPPPRKRFALVCKRSTVVALLSRASVCARRNLDWSRKPRCVFLPQPSACAWKAAEPSSSRMSSDRLHSRRAEKVDFCCTCTLCLRSLLCSTVAALEECLCWYPTLACLRVGH